MGGKWRWRSSRGGSGGGRASRRGRGSGNAAKGEVEVEQRRWGREGGGLCFPFPIFLSIALAVSDSLSFIVSLSTNQPFFFLSFSPIEMFIYLKTQDFSLFRCLFHPSFIFRLFIFASVFPCSVSPSPSVPPPLQHFASWKIARVPCSGGVTRAAYVGFFFSYYL